ncbi:pitrilysin family protein [Pelagicoccus sp. SDUM812003]|uniref:M16 family metallopeptidase n=1 Tax=Pelagicoccus sp. SDUM812003 TaxID=3041267 RepID=UPI00280D7C94|nr:pitrilysin family protein [Pelagicoccus sp. SDUM812003]MDQ8205127.1 pitrilysin family protein [Pelagicoccus sp. SDUM812003]
MTDFPQNRSVDDSRSLIAPLLKEPVERYLLPNGLTALLKTDRSSPVCSVQVWVKTGSVHEDRHLGSGISHFVEHMLFKGAERRVGKEIAREVHESGGYINAYTTFDRTVYYIDVPSENVEVALDVLSDSVFSSSFPEEEVDKEREVINREIAMGEDDPDGKVMHTLFETAFNKHNYRYPIIGYKDVFNRITRQDLLDYYNARYAPNNAVVVVTGDFDLAEMRRSVEKWFGPFARKPLPTIYLPDEPLQLAERRRDLYEDVQISRVAMGFQVPGLTHADTPALDALSVALGSGDSSLLYQHLREETQLVHNVDVSNWTPGSVGVFYVSLLCDPDKRDAALKELRRYVERLDVDSFSEEIVAKVRRQLLVNEVNSRKTVSGQAARLGAAEVVVGDLGYAKNYLKRIGEVTAEDLARVLKTWIRWDRLTVVTLNPKSEQAKEDDALQADSPVWDFEETRFPNGCALLTRENRRLPSVHIRVALQAGSLFEPRDKQGLSALLSTMMTKDTAKRSALEVAEAIEGAGGTFYEFSGNNSFGFALEVLSTDLPLALDLLEEALLRPSFDEEVFEIEKQSHLAGLKENLDDIVTCGREELRRRFFGEHPLRIGGSGSLDTVASITLEDVKAFWRSVVVSGNLSIAVSGDFTTETLKPQMAALIEKFAEGSLVTPQFVFEKPAQPGVHRVSMDRQQAIVFHAYPAPGLKGVDYFISEVADELFSGMSSELFDRVREKLSLAYFVRSSRIVGLNTTMFYFYAGTAPERYQEVIAELDREVKRVSEGRVAEDELARCKKRLKAAKRMSMQTNSSCASQAVLDAVYGLPINDWRNYGDRIDAVSIDSLQDFAKRYFSEENRVELVIGPVE